MKTNKFQDSNQKPETRNSPETSKPDTFSAKCTISQNFIIPPSRAGWAARPYTFIEVIVALAIFALAIVALLSVSTASSARINKTYEKWSNSHRTVQAAEYYLLAGGGSGIPNYIFPYRDSSASFVIADATLQDGVESRKAGWRLAECVVTLSSFDGRILRTLKIEKILKEDDI